MKFFEHAGRSLVKTITYRLLIIISTFTVTYFITGKADLSFGITFVATITNTFIYFLHERAWNAIHWGKTKK